MDRGRTRGRRPHHLLAAGQASAPADPASGNLAKGQDQAEGDARVDAAGLRGLSRIRRDYPFRSTGSYSGVIDLLNPPVSALPLANVTLDPDLNCDTGEDDGDWR